MKVTNMMSPNGNFVPNQFIIKVKNGVLFQSYQTIIAFKRSDGKVFVDHDWNYSRTTGKYRNMFLGIDTQETRRRIESEQIKVVDLNKDSR